MEKNLTTTRREIILLLKRSGGMTVEELGGQLGISTVGVRQHLSVLASDLLIASTARRQSLGRPAQVYRLTGQAEDLFPHQYDALAVSLLEQVEALYGKKAVGKLLEARKRKMLAQYLPRMEGKSLKERAEEVAKIFSENGSLGECRSEDGRIRLSESHCVLGKVSRRFPQVCQKEAELITELLGVPVLREQHQASGDSCCLYRILENVR